MKTYEETAELLERAAETFPGDFYKELNGGVLLLPDVKLHPESDPSDPLFVLGEYHYEPHGLGRYIVVYYGSFSEVHGNKRANQQEQALRRILSHEFTHHLESLAGERGLEVRDREDLWAYKQRRGEL